MKKILNTVIFVLLCSYCWAQGTQLEKEFKTPPKIQTGVYWYWMCGNISKEGVIADLKAMKKVGINRAFIGNNYFDPYKGGRTVRLMSDEWWDITHTALKTASELDIEIGIFNSPGWTQAGGPWVKPSQAMRYLTSSEMRIKGPATISTQLEKPIAEFQDVKVIAYPAPKNDLLTLNKSNSRIKISPDLVNSDRLFDGDNFTGAGMPQNVDVTVDIIANKE
ncbi:glycosyl hydrolase, partial [Dysgonomonas termitidis]